MQNYKTEQERFWAGDFGDEYIDRNSLNNKKIISGNLALFSEILSHCTDCINSVIEFGANIGHNLLAIKKLLPLTEDISAVEINSKAMNELKNNLSITDSYEMSIFDFPVDRARDFVLIKGVLIHLNPDMLEKAYEKIYLTSDKYICIVEYYNPSPVEVQYRGNTGKLFKRDFAGEMLDLYPDLSLIDYGFIYHRDNNFPLDDLTWFLLKKK